MGTAMTIGVGYLGNSNIILGSDMELTGVAKYPGTKDYFTMFKEHGFVAAVYSGDEDDIRRVWQRVENKIKAGQKVGVLEGLDVRRYIEETLASTITDKKSQFQMLVAIVGEEESPIFLRTFGKHTSPARGWEIIGRGDCELTRYLTGLMNHPSLTDYQAAIWAAHVINVANSFVQGVGQGIRLSVVYRDGRIQYMDANIFAEKTAEADRYVGGMWFDFCNTAISQEEYDMRLRAFTSRISAVRGGVPKILSRMLQNSLFGTLNAL